MKKHIGVIILAFSIVSILVLYSITFTVRTQEKALVLTLGRISRTVDEPGLQWKWPWPGQSVVKFDGRIRTLPQQLTQKQTKDQQNVILSVYVNWRIDDAAVFYRRFSPSGKINKADVLFKAEEALRGWISAASNIISEYNFDELVTLDNNQFKLRELEKGSADELGGMLKRVREFAASGDGYGIAIVDLGVWRLGVPDDVTGKVFARMREDRNAEVRKYVSQGKTEASNIISTAISEATIIKAKAQAQAKDTMGQGDAKAAEYYSTYLKNPELANFLRRLETLRTTLNNRTTIILDKKSPPYELLESGPELKSALPSETPDASVQNR
ncbi:MAG: protease modulator HflC [Sedimentisphaerales bacterium]|nr:protease modulator HflC [Sedimentisphaerales bacterium]